MTSIQTNFRRIQSESNNHSLYNQCDDCPSIINGRRFSISKIAFAVLVGMSSAGTYAADRTISSSYSDYVYGSGNGTYGSHITDADASSNSLTINSGITVAEAYGGSSVNSSYGSSYMTVQNNSVTNYGTVFYPGIPDLRGYIIGGYTDNGSALDNTVNNYGNTVTVYGGQAYGVYGSASATVSGNKVYNYGDVTYSQYVATDTKGVSGIYGGMAHIYVNSVSDNEVYQYSGTVEGNIAAGKIYQGKGGYGSVADNSVYLLGGTVKGYAAGGEIYNASPSFTLSGSISGNSVYVAGSVDLAESDLYGGRSSNANTNIHDNTLIFGYNNSPWNGSSSGSFAINSVNNFSTIRFTNAVWGKTIVIDTLSNYVNNSAQTTYVDASNVAFSGISELNVAESYDMLTVNSITSGQLALTSQESTFTVGTTLQGTGTVSLSSDGRTISYSIGTVQGNDSSSDENAVKAVKAAAIANSLKVQPQTHTAAMTVSAGTAALNQLADNSAHARYRLAHSGIFGFQVFSSIGGGASRVDSGSHISMRSSNFSLGLGSNQKTDAGILSYGVLYESGIGNFSNHFNAGYADPYISKSGHLSYYGGALTASMQLNSQWYVNALLRYGRIKSQQNHALYNAATLMTYNISLDSAYFGTELGIGKIFSITDSTTADLYGTYFFLHQSGNSFNAGGSYNLSAVESHRLRLGSRFTHSLSDSSSIYTDIGFEREFDGESKLKVDGLKAESANTRGNRVFCEIGYSLKPEFLKDMNINMSLKGIYGTTYKSGTADIELRYVF
ncbi:MAG: hypothetical protein SPK83_06135 [Succinivibrio dextrinosolvens]|nr:hypothetical protein [Succinivibrio dextrinosolvens]